MATYTGTPGGPGADYADLNTLAGGNNTKPRSGDVYIWDGAGGIDTFSLSYLGQYINSYKSTNFIIPTTPDAQGVFSITGASSGGTTITLKLSNVENVAFGDKTVTLATAPDTTAPVFQSAAVTGSSLVMTYNETLGGTAPAATQFTVSGGHTVTGVAVSGTKVTLSLNTPVANGETVTVGYSNPIVSTLTTNAAIQDVAGNDAISITAQSVTNNTAADIVAPALVTTNPLTVVGKTLVMTYNETLGSTGPGVTAFTVTGDKGTTPHTVTNVGINGTQVTLTLDTAVVFGEAVTIAYTNSAKETAATAQIPASKTNTAIQDTAGNDAADISTTSVINQNLSHPNVSPTGSVTITGSPTQNAVLTAGSTLADKDLDPNGASYITVPSNSITYNWFAKDTSTSPATKIGTGGTFTLAQAQVGKLVFVEASYTDSYGYTENIASSPTTAVANVNDNPTGSVTISGTPTITHDRTATTYATLTASNDIADLDGIPANGITYHWLATDANNVTTEVATGSSYTLTSAEVGKTITAKASYTDNYGKAETVTSTVTAKVEHVITGIAQDGYLQHAFVWVDTNNNNVFDSGTDVSAYTDSNGDFAALTGNGILHIQADPINPTSTIDLSTGKPFTSHYTAPIGSTVINPLTTLLVEAGAGAAALQNKLGLSGDLTSYDPLKTAATAATGADPANAVKAQSVAAQIANIMDIAASVAQGANGGTSVDVSKFIANKLATTITATTDLANSTFIATTINSLATDFALTATARANIVNNSSDINLIATQASTVNSNIAGHSTATNITDATSALSSIVGAQLVAHDIATAATAAIVSGTFTKTVAQSDIDTATAGVTSANLFQANHPGTGALLISGTPTVNQTLSVTDPSSPGAISDVEGIWHPTSASTPTFTYQWFTNGIVDKITGATGSTYTLTAAETGKTVSVEVSYTDLAGHSEHVFSTSTAQVVNTVVTADPYHVVNNIGIDAGPVLVGVGGLGVLAWAFLL